MFQDMQIPVMVSTDQKVVDTLDELIRDLSPVGFSMQVNPNTSPTTAYSVRGNGIMAGIYATITVQAATYSGSDITQLSGNYIYVKLATTTAGEVSTILRGFVDKAEGTAVSIGNGIVFKKGSDNLYTQNGYASLSFLRGARTATDPNDDEAYLVTSVARTNTAGATSIIISNELRIIHIPLVLSANYDHLPEEI